MQVIRVSQRDTLRGAADPVQVVAGARQFVLLLLVDTGRLHVKYRLEIWSAATDELVLATDELVRNLNSVSILLSYRLLPEDEYRLSLYGLDGERPGPATEYDLLLRW